jgi:DUF971 family protein
MKYLITLSLLFLTLFAQAQLGDCVIFSPDGEFFHVAIDNKFQNKAASKNIKIKEVPEGDYWVTILFQDKNKKGIKTTLQMRGANEISFQLLQEEGKWKLKQYSNIPKSQAQTVQSTQVVLNYNEQGVEVRGVKDATQLSAESVAQTKKLNMIRGEQDVESKRMGKFKASPENNTTAPAAATPEIPETGTTTISEYIKVENADGTTSIIEQKTTTYKEVVERNGQKFLKKKSNKLQYPTEFKCLPMNKDKFLALKEKVATTKDKLAVASEGIKDQCMTPAQLEVLADLLPKEQVGDFAMEAKSVCADPKKFPFTIPEPVAMVDEPKVMEEGTVINTVEAVPPTEKIEPVEDPKVEESKLLSKAELKAAFKAEKARLKAEKKAAKLKAKAEKKAAKLAAKAAKKKK